MFNLLEDLCFQALCRSLAKQGETFSLQQSRQQIILLAEEDSQSDRFFGSC